ncbi:MAG: hypothetical protein QUS11_07135 [Candidatus Fermentibacter sp.]|nr:hypothetical protein [Candidatus Fermentibacter sp.]
MEGFGIVTAVLLSVLSQQPPSESSREEFFTTAIGGPGMTVRTTDAEILPDGSIALAVSAAAGDFWFGYPWILLLDGSGGVTWTDACGEAGIPGVSRELEAGGWLELLADGSLLLASYAEPRATGVDAEVAVLHVTPGVGTETVAVIGADDEKAYWAIGMEALPGGSFTVIGRTCSTEDVPFEFTGDTAGNGAIRLDTSEGLYYFVQAFDLTPEGTVLACTDSNEEWLVSMDASGDTLIVTDPVPVGSESYFSILRCSRDRILLAGARYGSPWVACLDLGFNTIWETTLPQFLSGVQGMSEGPDGSLTICGFYADLEGVDGGGNTVLPAVCRLDASGEVEWTRMYEGVEGLWINSVDTAPDGTIILAGSARIPDADTSLACAWVARLDRDGLLPGAGHGEGDTVQLPDPARQFVMKPPLGMIAACGAFDSASDAVALAEQLSGLAGSSEYGWEYPTGVTWIPDWASLSGAEAWLAYVGPLWTNDEGIDDMMERIGSLCPDTYLVWAGNCRSRVTFSPKEVSRPVLPPDWD